MDISWMRMEYGKRNPRGIFDTLPCRLSWLTEIPNRTKLKVSAAGGHHRPHIIGFGGI